MINRTRLRLSFAIGALSAVCCAATAREAAAPARDAAAQAFDSTVTFDEQTVEIVMADAASAAQAKVAILPLYNGKQWAVTCRWDDNNAAVNAKLSALMKQHGIRGTFYLNGAGIFSNRTCCLKDGTDKGRAALKQMVSDVLDDGNSLGSHGWTHALPGLFCKNRIFEEFMRNRVQLESISDSPVTSHALAFNAYGNLFEPSHSGKVLGASLFRSGIYTLALWESTHHWPFPVPSPYTISSDGDPLEKVRQNLDALLTNAVIRATDPCMQFSIHPGGQQRPELEGQLFDLVAGKPEYWFCTQNDYAAYRTQLRLTEVSTSAKGNVLTVVLSRPSLESMNNAVPLTLAIGGVAPSGVREIRAAGTEVERQDAGDEARFNLPHDRSQGLPSKIDWIANEDNAVPAVAAPCASRKFPGLSGLLWKDGETLRWTLKNDSGIPLTGMHAICRLPVAYSNGAGRVSFDTLSPGAALSRTEPLAVASDDPKDRWGVGFFVVELNFTQGAAHGRLYLTVSVRDLVHLDDSYPNNNFCRIGPIPNDQYVPHMAVDIATGATDQVVLKNGIVLKAAPIELTPARCELLRDLDPETVFATGGAYMSRWKGDINPNEGVWIYRSTIISERKEEAIFWPTPNPFTTPGNALFNRKTVFINGKQLPGYDSSFMLRAGTNDLVIAYETAPLSIENIAFFCRIAARPHGKNPPWQGLEPRIRTIKYRMPVGKPAA